MVLSWASTSRPKHLPVASSGNAVSWRASHWHVRPIQPHAPGCASVDAHSHVASGVAARHRPAVPPAGNRRSRGHAALRLERCHKGTSHLPLKVQVREPGPRRMQTRQGCFGRAWVVQAGRAGWMGRTCDARKENEINPRKYIRNMKQNRSTVQGSDAPAHH